MSARQLADQLGLTNPRKADATLGHAPHRRKTATGMRQDNSGSAQTEGQNHASKLPPLLNNGETQ
jgi:prophage antirepressor-like protein